MVSGEIHEVPKTLFNYIPGLKSFVIFVEHFHVAASPFCPIRGLQTRSRDKEIYCSLCCGFLLFFFRVAVLYAISFNSWLMSRSNVRIRSQDFLCSRCCNGITNWKCEEPNSYNLLNVVIFILERTCVGGALFHFLPNFSLGFFYSTSAFVHANDRISDNYTFKGGHTE